MIQSGFHQSSHHSVAPYGSGVSELTLGRVRSLGSGACSARVFRNATGLSSGSLKCFASSSSVYSGFNGLKLQVYDFELCQGIGLCLRRYGFPQVLNHHGLDFSHFWGKLWQESHPS